jgi:hypothetical protein
MRVHVIALEVQLQPAPDMLCSVIPAGIASLNFTVPLLAAAPVALLTVTE